MLKGPLLLGLVFGARAPVGKNYRYLAISPARDRLGLRNQFGKLLTFAFALIFKKTFSQIYQCSQN